MAQINTANRNLSQSSDGDMYQGSDQDSNDKGFNLGRELLVGDALGDQEANGLLSTGLQKMVNEMIDGDEAPKTQLNQVQPQMSDSDSSSDSEEESDNYELPVLYSQNYIEGEQERIVRYTEIFLPKSKKIRNKLRIYNQHASGEVADVENELTRAKRRKLKADYKDLTAGLIHKAKYLPINPFLEDFYYLKNINKQGISQKKLPQQTQDLYRTLLNEKERQGAVMPNKLIATIVRKSQPRAFNREQRTSEMQGEAQTKVGTESDSDSGSVIMSCQVQEMREHFITPNPFVPSKLSTNRTNFPAPRYSDFEKQIFAFQKEQDDFGQPLKVEEITDQMMQEWIIDKKFAQLSNNGASVKRKKYWGELQDASSIQQLEKDYHTIAKYDNNFSTPFKSVVSNSDIKKHSARIVESLEEYEIVKNRNEQYRAPKKSQVTAASIMRLVRFKMGQISEEKFYEMELKEMDVNFNKLKIKQRNKDEELANYNENLDAHFEKRKSEIQQENYRKKELKDKENQQGQKQPITTAYEPVSLQEPVNVQKEEVAEEDRVNQNKAEGNSDSDISSSSESDEEAPNAAGNIKGVRVTQTMGEELNHAKCIEGHAFYKLDWSHKDLQHFHRPDIQSCFEGYHTMPAIIKPLNQEAVEERLNPHEYFKDKDKLSLKARGKFCIFEHVDQHPLFVNNFGMASRLKRYYYGDKIPSEKIFRNNFQNKETRHMGPHGQIELKGSPQLADATKPELGIVPAQHLNLLGQINTQLYKGLTVLENKMFNAPVFYQKSGGSDFFCSITKTVAADGNKEQRIVLRELENLYSVGQIEPKLEVYNPQSRDFQNFIKKRCKAYIIRLLEENDKVYFSDIQRLFPQIRDQILKNGMKETEIEIDRNGVCNFNQSKYVPERFKDRMTPEMICQFESACHGQYRLQRLGITEILSADKISYSTNKFNREETDITLRRIAKLIEKEVLGTPWNLSQSYIKVKQTQEMMMLKGDGDPSYGNGGYSFLKMPLKISADSLQGAKDNRMNLNPAIKNPKAVTRTDADLRKLQKDDIFRRLVKLGFSEEQLANKSRWEMVGMLRHCANEENENQKFQRGVRYTSDKQRQQYNTNTNTMFEQQMKTLSSQNVDAQILSEDEPDFTLSDPSKVHRANQGKNATDYSDEIKTIAKDAISKLSVETTAEEIKEIQRIEDIPNFLNLLLLKLDRMPPLQGQQHQGITMTGSSSTILTADILEQLPPESLEDCKRELEKQLEAGKVTKKCEVLCLRIRNLNQSNDTVENKFNKVLFFSSEKIIKKFNRYRNKNEANARQTRKPRIQNQMIGLTAEQLRQNQEVRSGGESTTSRPIGQKQQEILAGGISIVSGGFSALNKPIRRKQKARDPVPQNQPIVKVNFTATSQPINQDSVSNQVSQPLKIQLQVPQDQEDIVVELSDENQDHSVSDSVMNCEEEKSEEYSQIKVVSRPASRPPKQLKLKKQPSAVSRFKNVGVSRDDFAYENPTTNTGSTRRRQQHVDQSLNEIFKQIVQNLLDQDQNRSFHNRVTNKEAPNYTQIIQRPICLKDIFNKTKQNAYKKSAEFLADLELMSENSNKYNGTESWFSGIARELLQTAVDQVNGKRDEIMNLEGLIGNTALQY